MKAPQPGLMQKVARDIKNTPYVDSIMSGLLLLLIEVDNVWGADWISGQILPQPECVIQVFLCMCILLLSL